MLKTRAAYEERREKTTGGWQAERKGRGRYRAVRGGGDEGNGRQGREGKGREGKG